MVYLFTTEPAYFEALEVDGCAWETREYVLSHFRSSRLTRRGDQMTRDEERGNPQSECPDEGEIVVEPCGCEWHRDDAAGLWYPCDRAKKNRLDFCPLTEMSTDSQWRDEC